MASLVARFADVKGNSVINLKSDDILLFMVYAAHDYQFNVYKLSQYILGIFSGEISDENYPKLYKEGVFQKWGDNDEEAIIMSEEAYSACMNDLRINSIDFS